ncbi:disulphide bond formation protein DsbB/BdbC [Formosa agariphila KMM 3901]|uniref:Disulphide bond formation protein DsbB/BdbC n=1 Tax=Formosa agariphila (strain DSM 15362 / KCTC 12365 / LMG 23005 / KMM 3901 / M-2Alg 35-1) TaxID=1347342 RepID=T2KNB6_FORAG|nr:disulfide bond formation protein B [Formosa agariphila]CDF79958.1 disulphide bond formation protein DsbB/BdbC [Formosa agariphila KMM 3901]
MNALKIINSSAILIICSILIGAFYFQFGLHEDPCPLCLLQRIAMIAVIFGLCLNTYFGFKAEHFGIIIISALIGITISTRQVLLHICPVPGEAAGYGSPIFGMYLYSWGVVIFAASILASAILLFFIPKAAVTRTDLKISLFEKSAVYLAVLLILINVIATLFECQLGPCCDDGPCL